MIRTYLIAGLLLASLASAQETSSNPVDTGLELERQLLALDLTSYEEARRREQGTSDRVAEVVTRIDEVLAGETLSLGTLEALREELDAAREAARTATARVDLQIQKLEERLQRIGFLEGEAAGGGQRAVRQRDALTGRWRVRIQPQDRTGTFELRLAGSVVTGTYQMEGEGAGASGSLRGTLTGNVLRLERIDSQRGFDATFDGRIGASGEFITGSWTANELAAGEAARGGWSALRLSQATGDIEEEDIEEDGQP